METLEKWQPLFAYSQKLNAWFYVIDQVSYSVITYVT